MNDPRESVDWSFGGTNIPYEEIFNGYYNENTHFDCQYKFGNIIRDSYQVLCFSGAKEAGWNNEMMWAHYGGLSSGVCLEFDEDSLMKNIKEAYPNTNFKIDDIDYSNTELEPWVHWNPRISYEQNMNDIFQNLCKPMTLSKSKYWSNEDEKRLVFTNSEEPFYIPILGALKTVYVGINFNKKVLLESIFKALSGNFKLSMLIYQKNRFERWGLREKAGGGISTCQFENMLPNLN
ncbi:DUF2971 domain-containing protein [Echinicola strongylocentroti]|nr:DUF2971 domain-containing protein [Echinicola strongylocentroti]